MKTHILIITVLFAINIADLFSANRDANEPLTPYYLLEAYPQNLPQDFRTLIFDHMYKVNKWPDPINTRNGNLYLGYEDIYIPSAIPTTVYRSYNSTLAQNPSPFGYGWTFNYNIRIHETEFGSIEVEEGDGYVNSFTKYGKTKSVKKTEAEYIVKRRIADDKADGELRTKEYYKEMFARLLVDDTYFLSLRKNYGRKKEKITLGTYYSLSRGNKKLEKREKGYILYYPDGVRYIFDSNGKVLSISNSQRAKVRFSYKDDKLERSEDEYGRKLYFTYKKSTNLISEIKDPIGRITSFAYDDNENLISFKNPRGAKTSFEYDQNHRMTKLIFPDKGAVSIKYSASTGRVEEESGPKGDVTKFIYGEDKLKDSHYFTKIIDANGNTTVNYYYDDERMFKQILAGGISKTLIMSECCGMPIQTKDENGNMTFYAYDDGGKLTRITDKEGNITKFEYGENNNLVKIEDSQGVSQYVYKNNKIIELKNLDKTTIKYEYNDKGNLSGIIDPMGNKKIFTYDEYDYLSGIIDANGSKVAFVSDSIGRVVKFVDAKSNEYKFDYDKNDNVISISDPLNRVIKFTYDIMDNITKMNNSRGDSIEYVYDLDGKLVSIIDPLGNKQKFEYDKGGRIKSFTNALLHKTLYTFDARGRIVEIKDPEGNSYRYIYDGNGNLVSYINPLSDSWHYKYDRLDRMVERISPDGNHEKYVYNSNNNLTSATLNKVSTEYEYGQSGRLHKTKYSDGTNESYKYDLNGNVARVTNSSGYYLLYGYDKINRLISISNPLNEIVKYTYDQNSNVTNIQSFGNKYEFTYDKLDKLTNIITGNGINTLFDYDDSGNLVGIKDGNGNATSYKYDKLNRLISIIDREGNSDKYAYNSIGNRISYVNPKAKEKKFIFDKLNRPISVTGDNAFYKNFKYDANGNVIEVKNNETHFAFSYDSQGRIVRIVDKNLDQEVNIRYSVSGKISQIIYPDRSIIAYNYDERDRLKNIVLPNKKEININYKNNLAVSEKYPNGVTTSYNYTTHEEKQGIHVISAGDDQILNLEYFFDNFGNPITIKSQSSTSEYKYDNLNRVTRENNPNLKKSFAYKYDGCGNRAGIIKDKTKILSEFNSINQIVKMGDITKYTYDKNGNLIEKINGKNKTAYNYDLDSNLVSVTLDGKEIVSFSYDAFGRRYSKKVQDSKYLYLYSILNVISESSQNGKEIAKYFYNGGYGDPLGMILFGESNIFIKNLEGSIVSLIDSNGKEIANYSYSAYGELLKEPKIYSPFMYNGREYDKESGLYYFLNRYYDPETGTYISKDPIDVNGGINLYNFANSNPMRFTDPLGLFFIENIKIPTKGDRLTLGMPRLETVPESFPILPSFPNPGDLDGYGATYGRTPAGTAIFRNLNHPFASGNATGGGGKYGVSRLSNIGIIGKLLTATYAGDIYFQRDQLQDPLMLFRSRLFQASPKVTISKIYESMLRSPFNYADDVGRWLWSGRESIFYWFFPKRDDPFFTTPRIGIIDFLNLPRRGSLFGTNLAIGAERGLGTGLGGDYVKNSIMQNFKKLDAQYGRNSYDLQQSEKPDDPVKKTEEKKAEEKPPAEKHEEPIANTSCQ